jgi:phosphohistidine swiveling domain-containing protein
LARAAFVATDLLRSTVGAGLISQQEVSLFLRSLRTPTSRLLEDVNTLDRKRFLEIYGHLRPGTYDIRIPSYAEDPDHYLPMVGGSPYRGSRELVELDQASMARLGTALRSHGLQVSAETFMRFIGRSVAARENAKFVFSRSVSRALDIVYGIGTEHGFSREELSFADIRDILDLRVWSWEPRDILARSIEIGMERYERSSSITLPPLIQDPCEVWAFHVPSARPNFITKAVVEGPVRTPITQNLEGAIVLIPNADPGYDWLFGKHIGGLVTAYGGSNSHMAIRATELGLPAVIGAGETLFGQWSQARQLRIDCGVERVEVIA